MTVLVVTRNEELNIAFCLESVRGLADQIFVIDSESSDRTVDIARPLCDYVERLPYDHSRIIPWIFQWSLDHLPIRNDWILILEADQVLTPELREDICCLLCEGTPAHAGYYLRRLQYFRGKKIRYGGYGGKRLLKLFRRSKSQLDPKEQDTRVYVNGSCGQLRGILKEHNRKEDAILFYLEKHLRYADAFAAEENERRSGRLSWKTTPRFFGTPDQRILWLKSRYYQMPLYIRPFGYFFYRYVILLGFLDGKEGFVFHFLQAFWFRLVIDIRLDELRRVEHAGNKRH